VCILDGSFAVEVKSNNAGSGGGGGERKCGESKSPLTAHSGLSPEQLPRFLGGCVDDDQAPAPSFIPAGAGKRIAENKR